MGKYRSEFRSNWLKTLALDHYALSFDRGQFKSHPAIPTCQRIETSIIRNFILWKLCDGILNHQHQSIDSSCHNLDGTKEAVYNQEWRCLDLKNEGKGWCILICLPQWLPGTEKWWGCASQRDRNAKSKRGTKCSGKVDAQAGGKESRTTVGHLPSSESLKHCTILKRQHRLLKSLRHRFMCRSARILRKLLKYLWGLVF